MESFWAWMQVELLDRRRWRTRIELANAIFEYLEIFHNRQRRHTALRMRSPIEYEIIHHNNPAAASLIQMELTPQNQGTINSSPHAPAQMAGENGRSPRNIKRRRSGAGRGKAYRPGR